jgi:hypothetical protein
MGALSKISQATPTKGGNNIKDGDYLYFITRVSYDERGYSGPTYVFEFRVIEATQNGATDEPKEGMPRGNLVVPNPVGSECSLVCLLDKFDNAGGNAKACALAALAPLGYTEEQITEQLLLDISSANNPLRGVAVRNNTVRQWNKGKKVQANLGKALTINRFAAVAQTEADIAQRRAWLDANPARAEITAAPAAQTAPAPAVTQATAPAQPVEQPAPTPQPAAQPSVPVSPATSPLLSRLGVK